MAELTLHNHSASTATIVRFPYLYSLTDVNDFLYSTSDVAIWSTVETGLGITAAAVATLRPLLKTFFGGGSSARGHGTSAGHWHRTGSDHPKGGEDGFDMHDLSNTKFGVTTVIDYGKHNAEGDLENQDHKGDNASEASDSVEAPEDWNSSQSNLADKVNEDPRNGQAWNIKVEKSIVQTRV